MKESVQIGELQPSAALAREAYVLGDLSTAEAVTVASATGNTKEQHASGSYGAAPEVLGSVTGTVVEL